MDYKREDQVIYLKDLLFSALYRWKGILVCAIAFAVLLGGIKGVLAYRNMKNDKLQSTKYAQQELEKEVYKSKKESLEQQILDACENVSRQKAYLDESVLMNLDSYQFYEIYISVFVDTDYEILTGSVVQNPDLTNAVINAYSVMLTGEGCTQILAEGLSTQPAYVLELMAIEAPYDTRSFAIRMKVPDQKSAQSMAELLLQQLEDAKPVIADTVGEHEIRVVKNSIRENMDNTLAELQKQQVTKFMELNSSISALQMQKTQLLPPEVLTVNGKTVIKDAAVYAVVGGVLGCMLMVLVVWVMHICDSRVYSARVLQNRTGAKLLGCMPYEVPKDPVNRWLWHMEGRCCADVLEQVQLLAVDVCNRCTDVKWLLVTGDADFEARQPLVDALRTHMPDVRVEDCGSVHRSAAAIEALSNCDAVLLMEQCKASCYPNVEKTMEMVADYGKHLVGCVVLDG